MNRVARVCSPLSADGINWRCRSGISARTVEHIVAQLCEQLAIECESPPTLSVTVWPPKWFAVAFANRPSKRFWDMPHHKRHASTFTKPRWKSATSIRMRLAPTGRRPTDSIAIRACTLVVLLASLVACSTGTADDSRRFQSIDASQTPQLPGAQATHFAQTFGTPDASPLPSITPHASISELSLATSVSSDGSPGNVVQSVSGGQTVYAVASVANIQPGQVVSALFRDKDNNVIASLDQTPAPSSNPQWLNFQFQFGGVPRGTYSIAIVIGPDLLESVSFEIR